MLSLRKIFCCEHEQIKFLVQRSFNVTLVFCEFDPFLLKLDLILGYFGQLFSSNEESHEELKNIQTVFSVLSKRSSEFLSVITKSYVKSALTLAEKLDFRVFPTTQKPMCRQ